MARAAAPLMEGRAVGALRELAEGLWVVEHPFVVAGLHLGGRMTVIRLDDGSLMLHSPTEPDDDVATELDALGPVRHLVAPNPFHHLFLGAWRERYPGARLYAAPGLPKKRPDLTFDAVLGQIPEPAWSGLVDQHVFGGAPKLAEVVFLHRPSHTLLVTDLACNFGRGANWLTRMYLRLSKAHERFGQSFLVRLAVRDPFAARRSVELILCWPFDRLVVTHGDVLETGGRAAFASVFSWLPPLETVPSQPETA
jgi:hypothetical protein